MKEKTFNKSAYDNEYVRNNYDRISVTVPRGHKAQYQEHAEQRGESLNGFIQRAIRETIERDTQEVTQ